MVKSTLDLLRIAMDQITHAQSAQWEIVIRASKLLEIWRQTHVHSKREE
jgi:hypothetical protein